MTSTEIEQQGLMIILMRTQLGESSEQILEGMKSQRAILLSQGAPEDGLQIIDYIEEFLLEVQRGDQE